MSLFLSVCAVLPFFSPAQVGAGAGNSSAVQSKARHIYQYDTPGIRLEGTLVQPKVYGPPGYGETPSQDARETILVLKLSHPIDVKPTANAQANGSPSLDPVRNVREVQIFLDRSQAAEAGKLAGQIVIATGTLNESLTASQRTKVFLEVQSLKARAGTVRR